MVLFRSRQPRDDDLGFSLVKDGVCHILVLCEIEQTGNNTLRISCRC